MKLLFAGLVLFFTKTQAQKIYDISSLSKENLYMVCRGTSTKGGIVSSNFNERDTNISHIGIGFFENDRFVIYNVSDISKKKSALLVEEFDDFCSTNNIFYTSIWECEISNKELFKAKYYCNTLSKKKIVFDNKFELAENDTLYCSEFCINVLKYINKQRFKYVPQTKKIDNYFIQTFIRKKSLTFYSVDFFEKNKLFKKVFETKIN